MHHTGKSAFMTTRSRSRSRSPAWRDHDVRSWVNKPTNVGVPQAPNLRTDAEPVPVGRMGIRGLVGEDVVAPMVGHPPDRAALEGHRSSTDQHELQRPVGDEGLVGEEPVGQGRIH